MDENKITPENYRRLELLINENKAEIADIEKSLSVERKKFKSVSDTLNTAEKIAAGTYVQSLMASEKEKQQTKWVQNGLKRVE